jgi:hypothetical protein
MVYYAISESSRHICTYSFDIIYSTPSAWMIHPAQKEVFLCLYRSFCFHYLPVGKGGVSE